MRQLVEPYPTQLPEADLDPVSAFEGLAFTNRVIGAHADQLNAQFGQEAVAQAIDSVHGHMRSLDEAARPSREQVEASSIHFLPHIQSVVYRGLALAAEDGETNTYLGSVAGNPDHERARRANQRLAGMVLRQFVEGNTEYNRSIGQAAPTDRPAMSQKVVRPANPATTSNPTDNQGRHRRSEGASRPATRSTANHAPRHAKPGAFSGGRLLSRVPGRRNLRHRVGS